MTHPDDNSDAHDPALDMDLLAYADGTLPPEQRIAVEARLARDPAARDAVAQWRHADNVIRSAAQGADTLPPNLRIAALERELAGRLARRRWRATLLGPGVQRLAAGVVLFATGWWANGVVGPQAEEARSAAYPAYVNFTVAGHAAHRLASFQSAEFSGDDMDAALDWLSDRMQRKIDSPKLEQLGYRVESARLIEVDDRPVAVFYYRNPDNKRITVSMSPRDSAEPQHRLRLANTRDGQMAYWSGDTLHYAVVGGSDVADLTTLAAAIQR